MAPRFKNKSMDKAYRQFLGGEPSQSRNSYLHKAFKDGLEGRKTMRLIRGSVAYAVWVAGKETRKRTKGRGRWYKR